MCLKLWQSASLSCSIWYPLASDMLKILPSPDGASTEPDNNFGEGPSTAAAPPTPKRTRIAPAVACGEEDEDLLSEEGSDADGEWEPDWQSEEDNKDDDIIIDLTQVSCLLKPTAFVTHLCGSWRI